MAFLRSVSGERRPGDMPKALVLVRRDRRAGEHGDDREVLALDVVFREVRVGRQAVQLVNDIDDAEAFAAEALYDVGRLGGRVLSR